MNKTRTSFGYRDEEQKEKIENISGEWDVSVSKVVRTAMDIVIFADRRFDGNSREIEKLTKDAIKEKTLKRNGLIQKLTNLEKPLVGPDSVLEEKTDYDVDAILRIVGRKSIFGDDEK